MRKVLVKDLEEDIRLSRSSIRRYHLADPDAESVDVAQPLCGKYAPDELVARNKKYARAEGLEPCANCTSAKDNEHMVRACPDPECDDTHIRREAGGINKEPRPAKPYRCEVCGNRFHEPKRRPAKVRPTIGQGIAAKLAQPDVRSPEDVVLND